MRIGQDFKSERSKWFVRTGSARNLLLFIIQVRANDRWNIEWRWEEIENCVEEWLHPFILKCCATDHRNPGHLDTHLAQSLKYLFTREFLAGEIFLDQALIVFCRHLDEICPCSICFVPHISRNIFFVKFRSERLLVIDDSLHFYEIDNASEIVLDTNRELNRNWLCFQSVTDHLDTAFKVCTCSIHFVHKADSWHTVAVRLAPNSL